MKNVKWTKLMALSLALLMPLIALGETPFGAAALSEGKTYTVEEMLTYAIQDEYLARAEYKVIMDAYGEQRPFINIMKAEGVHVQRLLPLFTAYGVTVPEDTALEHTVKPDSLAAAYEAGVTAEVNNIAMYEAFLKQEDLPDDVRAVFEALMRASGNHLRAFEQNAAKPGMGNGNSGAGNARQNGGGRSGDENSEPVQGRGWRRK